MLSYLPSPTTHFLAVVLGLLVYIHTTRSRRYRRPPTAAIAWVLGIMALPYLTLPAYLLFGSRKLLFPGAPPRQTPAMLPPHWAEQLLCGLGVAPASGVRIELHRDGAVALAALTDVIQSAKARLDVATFILGADDTGRGIAGQLIARARDGVQVRLLIDGMGAFVLPRGTRRRLTAAGVEVRIFRPPLAVWSQGARNLRNHRKLTIADGRRLWAGGRNLAGEYFLGSAAAPPWRDLSFDLEGGVATEAAAQFELDWLAAGGVASPSRLPQPAGRVNGRAQFVPSGPDQREDTVYALLVEACYRAERRIVAVTPYFVPDVGLETALRVASRRGVQVSLFMPARSNHRLADFARSRPLRALAAAGVEIELVPFMVHAKALVIDDSLAATGSVNLDLRSLLLNYEFAVALYDRPQIEWLARWIDELRPHAERFEPTPPGLVRDLAEGLVITVAFQL